MTTLIGFILSPAGRIILVVLAFVLWTIVQRDQAADRARDECRADQIQQTLDEVLRQRDAARASLAEAERQARRTEAELRQLEIDRDQIIEDLQDRGTVQCAVPDDIIERLRNIR